MKPFRIILHLFLLTTFVSCGGDLAKLSLGNTTTSGFTFPDEFLFGQPDYGFSVINNGGVAADRLNQPEAIWRDGKKVFLCDRDNARLLIWNDYETLLAGPLAFNKAPDVVLFQPDFVTNTTGTSSTKISSCRGIFTINNKLFVSDALGNRVLGWNSIPTVSNTPADFVLGQPDFTTNTAGTTSSKMSHPMGIGSDGTKLFVADRVNHRILVWNTIPSGNQPADYVLGQPNFTSNTANGGGVTSARVFNHPLDVKSADGKLFVVDRVNQRILVWNTIPSDATTDADFVLGQNDFTSSTTGLTDNQFSSPWSILLTSSKLYVADYGNNRLLGFDLPIQNDGASATFVLGQSNFTTNVTGNDKAEVAGIIGAISIGDHFILADQDNHRLISDLFQSRSP